MDARVRGQALPQARPLGRRLGGGRSARAAHAPHPSLAADHTALLPPRTGPAGAARPDPLRLVAAPALQCSRRRYGARVLWASVGRSATLSAGLPATIDHGSTSPLTTAPAATTAPSPTREPGRIMARAAIQTRSPIATADSTPAKSGERGSCSAVR